MSNVAVKVTNVNKTFVVPHERHNSLKQTVFNLLSAKRFTRFEALKNINFEVKPGEFYGIIGRNGSGKSTLLKILAQIYQPSHGEVVVNGRLSPFIELGVGFNMELTGRENIYLNGTILGLTKPEINRLFDEIVRFAELEDFIDQKLKNYSSGMQVRLAFSIAIRAHRGILLIDEVLAVGDSAFQKKCFQSFYDLKKNGNTIIFVTHDMSAVKRFCDRVLIIDKGKQIAITDPDEAERLYNQLNVKKSEQDLQETIQSKRWGSREVEVTKVEIINHKGEINKPLTTGKQAAIKLFINSKLPKKTSLLAGLAFFNQAGVRIGGPNSKGVKISTDDNTVSFHIAELSLAAGDYDLTAGIFDDQTGSEYDVRDRGFRFTVFGEDPILGVTKMFGTWHTNQN